MLHKFGTINECDDEGSMAAYEDKATIGIEEGKGTD